MDRFKIGKNKKWIPLQCILPLQGCILKNTNVFQPKQAFVRVFPLYTLTKAAWADTCWCLPNLIIKVFVLRLLCECLVVYFLFCNEIHFLFLKICSRSGAPIVSLVIIWCAPGLDLFLGWMISWNFTISVWILFLIWIVFKCFRVALTTNRSAGVVTTI